MVESESTFAYIDATREYIERHGKQVAFYSDKHSVFRNNTASAKGDGKSNLTLLAERESRFAVLWFTRAELRPASWWGSAGNLASRPISYVSRLIRSGNRVCGLPDTAIRAGDDQLLLRAEIALAEGRAVENFNGRLRRFMPSDTDIAAMDPADIEVICAQLNSTPRKCLGYQTPLEVLSAEISRHSE